MAGGKIRTIQEIQCNPAVTHQHINSYCQYCPHDCDNCRRVMQRVRLIVTTTPEARRKDFEATCYGDHISLCFWSGSRENKFVYQMEDGVVHEDVITTRKNWREWLKEVFVKCWEKLKNVFVRFEEESSVERAEAYQIIENH